MKNAIIIRFVFAAILISEGCALTLGVLFAFVAAVVAAKYFLPSSAADVALRVMCHPAFVVPVWLFMMWGLFHHYQRQRRRVDA
jgi:hypothetical protein